MILGIYHPAQGAGHDTGVALVDRQGRIIAGVSEERLSRVKMDGGFPFRALETIQRMTGVRWSDLDAVAVPFLARADQLGEGVRLAIAGLADPPLLVGQLHTRMGRDDFQAGMREIGAYGYVEEFFRRSRAVREADHRSPVSDWRAFLSTTGLASVPLVQVDHHLAHAAGAYWMSGFDDALVMTCDGLGALKSSIVAIGQGSRLRVIGRTFYPNSPGGFWEAITAICGFHHMKHGGKITGLAAHGNADAPCYNTIKATMEARGLTIRTHVDPVALSRALQGVPREDIAAAAQRRLIEVVTAVVRTALAQTGRRRLALAGGVFGNVRLNQAISELPGVDEVFICPPMGDEGLGVGSAMFVAGTKYGAVPARVPHMYYGPEYTEAEMREALEAHGLKADPMGDEPLAAKVVERLVAGKVIAVARGRLELGPRALGHRTILYQTGDASVNDWLNKRLERTEFMPFAPVTLDEEADRCYSNLACFRHAAEFMTITRDCSAEMRRTSPAVVHLDGTARPQLIRRDIDAFYYDVLSRYHRLTGVASLVNTSFNMHEEPIVCTPGDSVRAFMQGRLDTLVLGRFLVDAPGGGHADPR